MCLTAGSFTLACVKFSLNSKVDILSPRLAKLYQLFSDHIVYINDLASYDKEKAAYNRYVPLYARGVG